MQFGDYQLIRRIASGGMAEIFVGRVRGLGGVEKIVVVKRILPSLSGYDDLVQMFIDEARIVATLQHPNIVQMHEVGEVEGRPFIAMEYLHGEDIRALMSELARQQRDLPLERALEVIVGMCNGLHYAHEKRGARGEPLGIVHRDISPHNVVVTYDGTVKVVDFGIAMAENRQHQTKSHVRKGKVQYMSPEQVRCQTLDRRSDVFAVGIMLHELTTGRRLFKGENEFQVTAQIDSGVIRSPRVHRPDYPAELERILLKALATDAAERYQSARDLQADLEAFAHRAHLQLSSMKLSDFMGEVFGTRLEAWRELQTSAGGLDEFLRDRHPGDNDATAATTPSNQPAKVGALTGVTKDLGPTPTPTPTPTLTSPAIGQILNHAHEPPAETNKSNRGVAILATLGLVAAVAAGYVLYPRGEEASATSAARGAEPVAPAPPPTAHIAAIRLDAGPTAIASPDARPRVVASSKKAATSTRRSKRRAKDKRRRSSTPVDTSDPKTRTKPPETKRQGLGELRVASKPSCEVIIGGRSRGHTSLSVRLPAGTHTLRLRNTEYGIDEKHRIVINAGKVTKKRYRFKATAQ